MKFSFKSKLIQFFNIGIKKYFLIFLILSSTTFSCKDNKSKNDSTRNLLGLFLLTRTTSTSATNTTSSGFSNVTSLTLGGAFVEGTVSGTNKIYYSFDATANQNYVLAIDEQFGSKFGNSSSPYKATLTAKVFRADQTTVITPTYIGVTSAIGFYTNPPKYLAPATEKIYIELTPDSISSGEKFIIQVSQSLNWISQTISTSGQAINSIYCIDVNTCIAVGKGSVIRRTTDGGNTWSSITTPNAGDYVKVICSTSTNCIAATGSTFSGIYHSTDAGLNWTVKNLGHGVSDISCGDANTCYAASITQGNFSKTIDGGNTWTNLQTFSNTLIMSGISCPSALVCYGIQKESLFQESLFKTVNGGTSWTITTPISIISNLISISCSNTNTCIIATKGGSLANHLMKFTNDGGTTWSDVFHGFNQEAKKISCNSGKCILSGGGTTTPQMTVATNFTDVNSSWTSQKFTEPSTTSYSFEQGFCASATVCYIPVFVLSGSQTFILKSN
jgi:photosystem II stability/assembly factor-like uncharacterized protein